MVEKVRILFRVLCYINSYGLGDGRRDAQDEEEEKMIEQPLKKRFYFFHSV